MKEMHKGYRAVQPVLLWEKQKLGITICADIGHRQIIAFDSRFFKTISLAFHKSS